MKNLFRVILNHHVDVDAGAGVDVDEETREAEAVIMPLRQCGPTRCGISRRMNSSPMVPRK